MIFALPSPGWKGAGGGGTIEFQGVGRHGWSLEGLKMGCGALKSDTNISPSSYDFGSLGACFSLLVLNQHEGELHSISATMGWY